MSGPVHSMLPFDGVERPRCGPCEDKWTQACKHCTLSRKVESAVFTCLLVEFGNVAVSESIVSEIYMRSTFHILWMWLSYWLVLLWRGPSRCIGSCGVLPGLAG